MRKYQIYHFWCQFSVVPNVTLFLSKIDLFAAFMWGYKKKFLDQFILILLFVFASTSWNCQLLLPRDRSKLNWNWREEKSWSYIFNNNMEKLQCVHVESQKRKMVNERAGVRERKRDNCRAEYYCNVNSIVLVLCCLLFFRNNEDNILHCQWNEERSEKR